MSLFPMISGRARVRLVQAGAVLMAAALATGCGNNYRPVVTPINPNGPGGAAHFVCGGHFIAFAHHVRHCHHS